MAWSREVRKMGDIGGIVYQRPGTKKWWLKFYVDGKPIRESSGKEDRDEALERLKVRIAETFAASRNFLVGSLSTIRAVE